MKEQLITFITAKLTKEKGFNINQKFHYNGMNGVLLTGYELDWRGYPATTQALLQKWLREEHGIKVISDTDATLMYVYTIQSLHPDASYTGDFIVSTFVYSTFEEALEVGLLEALKLIDYAGKDKTN